jgi:hypothetical protein
LAASLMASTPFAQNSHARHLHHMQWNFLNLTLQKGWHIAVAVSGGTLYVDTHWLLPCIAAAVAKRPPVARVVYPLLAIAPCVFALPSPEPRTCIFVAL